MANNLVETIQRNLGFPPLRKIDPNIQETIEKTPRETSEKLAQAAIPAVLTAMYRFTRSDEGCNAILSVAGHADWLGVMFKGKETTAVEKVARYAGVTEKEAERALENIADEAALTVKKSAGSHPTPETVKSFMNAQRHSILVYLPAAMQMGDLLNEESLDDRTNKMEGPFSNLMHAIENKLSRSDQSKYP
ncbi:MAG TPA: hypothetical protein VIZ28_06550 [Chitinophagaceae bacterium]